MGRGNGCTCVVGEVVDRGIPQMGPAQHLVSCSSSFVGEGPVGKFNSSTPVETKRCGDGMGSE